MIKVTKGEAVCLAVIVACALLFVVLVSGCSYKNTPNMKQPVHCDVTDVDGTCWESPREYAQGWENE